MGTFKGPGAICESLRDVLEKAIESTPALRLAGPQSGKVIYKRPFDAAECLPTGKDH